MRPTRSPEQPSVALAKPRQLVPVTQTRGHYLGWLGSGCGPAAIGADHLRLSAGVRLYSRLCSEAEGGSHKRTDELAFCDRFACPVPIDEAAVRSATGRAGAEAAVDAASPVRHCRGGADTAGSRAGSAGRWSGPDVDQVSVHRVDLVFFEPRGRRAPLVFAAAHSLSFFLHPKLLDGETTATG